MIKVRKCYKWETLLAYALDWDLRKRHMGENVTRTLCSVLDVLLREGSL